MSPTRLGFWVVSVGFGLWHVGDAILDARAGNMSGWATVVLAAVTITFTALISRFVLIPLRLRTGTIAAPILTHFASNSGGIVLGGP